MNYDKLVDLILEEVYKNINSVNASEGSPKKIAVVMGEDNIGEITKSLGNDYKISVYDSEDIDADILIIPELHLKSMANLATLVTNEPAEEFIIRMLMMGKEVYALENGLEYRRYKNTAPRALYSKYLDFEKQIKINGIQIIGYVGEIKKADKNLFNDKQNKEKSEKELSEELSDGLEVNIRNKRVVSEAEIKRSFIPGIHLLVIDKKSIITPLAADFIRIHNLRVKRV